MTLRRTSSTQSAPSAPDPTSAEAAPPNRAARRAARRITAAGSSALLVAGGAGLVGALASGPAGAAVITVTTLADSGPGSLRAAVTAADNGDTIDLTGLTGTITLTSGAITTTKAVTITGPGPDVLTVSGGGTSRILDIRPTEPGATGLTTTVSGVTIADGYTSGPGLGNGTSGLLFKCDGSSPSLVVDNVVFTGNDSPTFNGGALYFGSCETGSLTVIHSVFDGGESYYGGGLFVGAGTATVTDTTFTGNSAVGGAGALLLGNCDDVTVVNSTFSDNTTGGRGGAIGEMNWATCHLEVANSTFSGNSATDAVKVGEGGAVFLYDADAVFLQTTISGNSADTVGDAVSVGGVTSFEITGSIVAGNGDGTDDLAGTGNLDLTASVVGTVNGLTVVDGGGNEIGVTDPGLAALADNGGPTQTMALLETSPAIDAGPAVVPTFPGNEWDQRGEPYARVYGTRIDAGAFERQPGPGPGPTPGPTPEPVPEPTFTG